MKNLFISADEAADLIRSGAICVLAGESAVLATLPRGRWIGGSTPYFMTAEGGITDREKLFCTVLEVARDARVAILEPNALSAIAADRYAHGFSYVLLPAFSQAHRRYAMDAAYYPHMFEQAVMGWVTGVHLVDIGRQSPKVFDGFSGRILDNAAVVLYVQLPAEIEADIGTVNLFAPGDGPAIVFTETGMSAGDCLVDDRPVNFARWLVESGVDTKLPLVADYFGMTVNVSVREIDRARGRVDFYAPVVGYETYRVARPITDYAGAYRAGLAADADTGRMLSCNCVLNYFYAGLEGQTTRGFVGPVSFGEIAHVLLNQTLVRLHLHETAAAVA